MKKLLGFLILLGFLGASELPINKAKVAQILPNLTNAITVNGVMKVMDVSFKCFKEHKDLREQGIYVSHTVSTARENGNSLGALLATGMFRESVLERCGTYDDNYLSKMFHSVEYSVDLSMDLLSVVMGVTMLPFYGND